MLMDLWTFIDFDTILLFLGLKMEADILTRRGGGDTVVRRPRFLSQTHVVHFSDPPFYWKTQNQHFLQKLSFQYGFGRNRLGQNVQNGHGIISGFHQNHDFDRCLTGQSACFPENPVFHFFV